MSNRTLNRLDTIIALCDYVHKQPDVNVRDLSILIREQAMLIKLDNAKPAKKDGGE